MRGKGETHGYADTGTFVIGGIYTVEVDRSDERLSRPAPKYTGDRVDDEQRRALDVKDTAARTELARLALEKKHATDHALDDAFAPLKVLVQQTRTSAERDALAAFCMRMIYGGYR